MFDDTCASSFRRLGGGRFHQLEFDFEGVSLATTFGGSVVLAGKEIARTGDDGVVIGEGRLVMGLQILRMIAGCGGLQPSELFSPDIPLSTGSPSGLVNRPLP